MTTIGIAFVTGRIIDMTRVMNDAPVNLFIASLYPVQVVSSVSHEPSLQRNLRKFDFALRRRP